MSPRYAQRTTAFVRITFPLGIWTAARSSRSVRTAA
jgi:hypothetical protein